VGASASWRTAASYPPLGDARAVPGGTDARSHPDAVWDVVDPNMTTRAVRASARFERALVHPLACETPARYLAMRGGERPSSSGVAASMRGSPMAHGTRQGC
jgi:hypothetical protein